MYLLKNFCPLFALTQTKQKREKNIFLRSRFYEKSQVHPSNMYEEFTKAAVRLWRKKLILQSPK